MKKHANKLKKFKRKVACIMQHTPTRLVRQRRAASPVVANLILIAAVIVLGFAALAYARNISADYQSDYQQTVSSDIGRLKETLAFEYVFYAGGHLHVYVMNAGSIAFEVDKVYLSTSLEGIEPTVCYMNGNTAPNNALGIGDERMIDLGGLSLGSGSYTVRITTVRGSSFAYGFMV